MEDFDLGVWSIYSLFAMAVMLKTLHEGLRPAMAAVFFPQIIRMFAGGVAAHSTFGWILFVPEVLGLAAMAYMFLRPNFPLWQRASICAAALYILLFKLHVHFDLLGLWSLLRHSGFVIAAVVVCYRIFWLPNRDGTEEDVVGGFLGIGALIIAFYSNIPNNITF